MMKNPHYGSKQNKGSGLTTRIGCKNNYWRWFEKANEEKKNQNDENVNQIMKRRKCWKDDQQNEIQRASSLSKMKANEWF